MLTQQMGRPSLWGAEWLERNNYGQDEMTCSSLLRIDFWLLGILL